MIPEPEKALEVAKRAAAFLIPFGFDQSLLRRAMVVLIKDNPGKHIIR
jgi:hypothetical protein